MKFHFQENVHPISSLMKNQKCSSKKLCRESNSIEFVLSFEFQNFFLLFCFSNFFLSQTKIYEHNIVPQHFVSPEHIFHFTEFPCSIPNEVVQFVLAFFSYNLNINSLYVGKSVLTNKAISFI